MKKWIGIFSVTSVGLLVASEWAWAAQTTPPAQTSATVSPLQKQQIEKIVHDYIVQHPEVLVEASHVLQAREAEKANQIAVTAIGQNKDKLFSDPATPAVGPAKSDAVLVEFFDYQCGYCKAMQPIVESLIKKNLGLKVVFKEFPIFGGNSQYAAAAALAAMKQGKNYFYPFHVALLKAKPPLTPAKIQDIARTAGLNVSQLTTDMKSTAISQQIHSNAQLAQTLDIQATPVFIVANGALTRYVLVPGAMPEKDLQVMIQKIQGQPSTVK